MSYVRDQHREIGTLTGPPYIPKTFQSFIETHDVSPETEPYDYYSTPTNPFARKKILFICGSVDNFVLEGYGNFLDRVFIDEANGGSKAVHLIEGVSHRLVRAMITEMAAYLWTAGLASKSEPATLQRAML